MGSMKSWMFGAALAAGVVGMGAVSAHAAQFGVYFGAPAAYVPPCPGPGYNWMPGHWDDGYWVPGFWNYAGGVGFGYRLHDWDDHPYYDRRGFDDHRDDFRHWDRGDRFHDGYYRR